MMLNLEETERDIIYLIFIDIKEVKILFLSFSGKTFDRFINKI
jgi:hypothetical protein